MSAAGTALAGLTLALGLIAAAQMGDRVVVISGRSMEPAISLGALAVTSPLNGSNPGVGEVMTFAADNGSLVTHRVVRLLALDGVAYVATKGDANPSTDPALVPRARLIGRLTFSAPWVGYLVVAMAHPQGWAAFLATIAFLWLAAALLGDLATPAATRQPAYIPSPWGS